MQTEKNNPSFHFPEQKAGIQREDADCPALHRARTGPGSACASPMTRRLSPPPPEEREKTAEKQLPPLKSGKNEVHLPPVHHLKRHG